MPVRPDRVALVVNAAARSGAAAFETAHRLLVDLGVPLVACYLVTDPARLTEALNQAAAESCELIVVGGGDGTLSTAAEHLVRHRVTVGVLPSRHCKRSGTHSADPDRLAGGLRGDRRRQGR